VAITVESVTPMWTPMQMNDVAAARSLGGQNPEVTALVLVNTPPAHSAPLALDDSADNPEGHEQLQLLRIEWRCCQDHPPRKRRFS
jgi:hypothetical protein